ncbi:hypothetical protein [Amycolatopsis sp. DSM 110486]|uniref:hypothetical protein n=1 Tax=Amycolatopsis sp. DSM 110486 TaxID=2865832 RepID=UPI001C6A2020|nr:hypothetical protein [Amycolatopsis sp. DSM 110486]QYN21685.1 hypothetical protein K1T34_03855 [Amycolatopsis sp. DSM 110486]
MTSEQSTQDVAQPAWGGTPGSSSPGPNPRRKWVAGGVAAVVAVGGGAAIWIASSSADSGTATAAGPGAGAGARQGGPGGPRGAASLGQALHGEFTTTDDSGAYVTKFLQTGKVTALSATSLTAQSDDGFTKIYTIDSTTATGITNGEKVTIVATTSGDAATATSVTEAMEGPPSQ